MKKEKKDFFALKCESLTHHVKLVKEKKNMEKFEYKREDFDFSYEKKTFTDWLNKHGEDGWELVSVTRDYLMWICFFKRKKYAR